MQLKQFSKEIATLATFKADMNHISIEMHILVAVTIVLSKIVLQLQYNFFQRSEKCKCYQELSSSSLVEHLLWELGGPSSTLAPNPRNRLSRLIIIRISIVSIN